MRATAAGQRARQGVEGCPLLVVEEPGEPEREPADQAHLDRATNPRLSRAYVLKEGLRLIFTMPYAAAVEALERWISWARRCRIPSFVKLQRSIVKHQARILAAIEHNLSNGLIESTNTKIRLITRMAFGFKSPQALIALALLSLGGHRPNLPGRT